MKKFDIQRFAKRRIQVGDNLQGRIIYTDTFSKEEVEELANECDAWENYYIVSCTTTRPKSGIQEQMAYNEAENKISSYKIYIAGQTIIQYDGTDITTQNNEISFSGYNIYFGDSTNPRKYKLYNQQKALPTMQETTSQVVKKYSFTIVIEMNGIQVFQ